MANNKTERKLGFYWIYNDFEKKFMTMEWTEKGWTNDWCPTYYTDDEIGEIRDYIPYPENKNGD